MNIIIDKSKLKDKRFKAIIETDKGKKTVNFGSKNAYTYFDGAPDLRKNNYIKRHKELNEDWTKKGINTAGFWSKWYLWHLQNPTQPEQIAFFKNKFNVALNIKYFKKNNIILSKR